MSRRRKAIVALAAVAVIACAWWLWPRDVYRYQGKTVEQWFRDYTPVPYDSGVMGAFVEMGTNAVPFLASRINQDPNPSRLERWVNMLPLRFRPASKQSDALLAAVILHSCVDDPETILTLRELLRPALTSMNKDQVAAARHALAPMWR